MTWGNLTWDTARAAGLVAYGLLSVSVLLGLVLTQGWRTRTLTRFVSTELHRFTTLLALAFTALHGAALLADPFQQFGLPELLMPLASHYRPFWMALGILAGYLALALWVSDWARPRIGYQWWRRLHFLTFLAYALATVHGLGTGSDTRTVWALEVYTLSVMAVLLLLLVRLLWPPAGAARHPVLAMLAAGLVVCALVFAWLGPLQPGWNEAANGGNGSGSRVTSTDGAGGGAPTAP